MQRNQSKLNEARVRRNIATSCLILAIPSFVLWAFHMASGSGNGVRHIPFGEVSGYVALALLVVAAWVKWPVYRLEWPFQHSLDQKRKAGRR